MSKLSWPDWFRARRFGVDRILNDMPFEQIMEAREGLAVAQWVQPAFLIGVLPAATTKGTATFLPVQVDSNRRLMINPGAAGNTPAVELAPASISNTPADNTDAALTLDTTADFIGNFRIYLIQFEAAVDATVSSRTFLGRQTPDLIANFQTTNIDTSSLTLTASEEGSVWRAVGGEGGTIEVTNDNLTIATNTGKAPFLDFFIDADFILASKITANKQTGDRTFIRVGARQVA